MKMTGAKFVLPQKGIILELRGKIKTKVKKKFFDMKQTLMVLYLNLEYKQVLQYIIKNASTCVIAPFASSSIEYRNAEIGWINK